MPHEQGSAAGPAASSGPTGRWATLPAPGPGAAVHRARGGEGGVHHGADEEQHGAVPGGDRAEELLGTGQRARVAVHVDRQPRGGAQQFAGRHVAPAEPRVVDDHPGGRVHPLAGGDAERQHRTAPAVRRDQPGQPRREAAEHLGRRRCPRCGLPLLGDDPAAQVHQRHACCARRRYARRPPGSGRCRSPAGCAGGRGRAAPRSRGRSLISPRARNRALCPLTAAADSPVIRATVLRATGPWSRIAPSTAPAAEARRAGTGRVAGRPTSARRKAVGGGAGRGTDGWRSTGTTEVPSRSWVAAGGSPVTDRAGPDRRGGHPRGRSGGERWAQTW